MEITVKTFEVYKRDFMEMDTNGNGTLDGNEIEMLLSRQLGRKLTDADQGAPCWRLPPPMNLSLFLDQFTPRL